MNVIFYLVSLALNSFMLLVLPKKITRNMLVLGLFLSFMLISGYLEIVKAYADKTTEANRGFSVSIGIAIQAIIILSIANQLTRLMVGLTIKFQQGNNQENLHKLPVSLLVRDEENIKNTFTWFWVVTPVLVFVGIWF